MSFTPKALIFDMNGTMIDDMGFHLIAWEDVLNNELGAGMTTAQVRSHMFGKNDELLTRIFGPDRFTAAEMDQISLDKEKKYQQAFLPSLHLIAGLPAFLEQAAAKGLPMAIGTAAIPFNIDFVLDRLSIRHYFKGIVSADDVARGKPDPEVFLKCAALLNIDPSDCVVFEDAPKGIEAAANAGMQSVAITTIHSRNEFDGYENILHFIDDYTDPFIAGLL